MVSKDELKRLRKEINRIGSDNEIDKILSDGDLLPLLKSVATMGSEQQILYAMAIAESIQKRESSEKQNPGWFKGLIDKVEEILDLIKKLKP